MNSQSVKDKLRQLGISPRKSLGQNFLINKSICYQIIEKTRQLKPSYYVEIGPGLGALTQFLNPKKSLLIEKEKAFLPYWKKSGFLVLERDVLKVDFSTLQLKPKTILLSNLPYTISSRFLIQISLQHKNLIEWMVLMFQKEVAQRILSPQGSKNYGILSVMTQTLWNIENFLEVYPKDFYPPPQVAGQVLVFKKKLSPFKTSHQIKKFLLFVKKAFLYRRKYLKSNLKLKDLKTLEALNISYKARAEDLSPRDFVKLFCYIKKHETKEST